MSDALTIGNWMSELRRGNTQVAQELWTAYFDKLVKQARTRLPVRFRRAADEEDVALSALRTFVRRATVGEFAGVSNNDDLWRLLLRITARKAWKLMEKEGRKKRGGGHIIDEAGLATPGTQDEQRAIEQMIGQEPSPEFVVQVADTCEHFFQLLGDGDQLRDVMRLTLAGLTLEEIGKQLEFSTATAGRKLNRLRTILARET